MDSPEVFALVTGASSGIGWHISVELARRNYNILAISNQAEKLQSLKIYLEKNYQVKVITRFYDLSKEDAAESIFRECEKAKIQVEILVNNAGILQYGETHLAEYSLAKSLLQLHVTTAALLCRLFGERMVNRKKGYILNVASISAVMPYPTISLYGPSKAFIRKFTRAIRTEMKPLGLHITCLLPGATDTSFYENTDFRISRGKRLGIIKTPEKVAAAGIRAMFRNRPESIPGLMNKLVVWLLPIIPHSIINLIYRQFFLKSNEQGI